MQKLVDNISVCMIAKNCADIIGTSLRWACDNFDEVNVVVDPNNDDSTASFIASELFNPKIRVKFCEFDNFSAQKQRALDMATKPWILLLDSDEIFEDGVPWKHICKMLDKNFMQAASFYRFNLQRDVDHFKLPIEYVRRLVKKEHAKMDGKSVDETLECPNEFTTHLAYGIIHFGHIRSNDALMLKGKDRIKFIDSDPCDGPGMKKHGDKWFIERNDLWNENVAVVPENVKRTIRKYYAR